MQRKLVIAIFLLTTCASVAAAQARPRRVLSWTQVVTKVAPIYPPEAKRAHIQGVVKLRVFVSKTADVEYVKLISGHSQLAPAAIEAVRQWKYKPYLLNGEGIDFETTVTVNFTLADEPTTNGKAGDVRESPLGQPGGSGAVISVNADHPLVARQARVSQRVMQGLVIHKVQPTIPGDAAHIQGPVVLKATIDKMGNVAKLALVSGNPLLATAAIDAVRQWKFRPYLLDGKAVEIEGTLIVNFERAD